MVFFDWWGEACYNMPECVPSETPSEVSKINMRSYLVSIIALATVSTHTVALAASNSASVQAASYTVCKDGENALETGDYTRAQAAFSNALKDAGKDKVTEGYLRLGLGESLLWQGSMSEAGSQFTKASSQLKSADSKLQARLLEDQAWFYQAQGKMDKALDSCTASLAIRKAEVQAFPYPYVMCAMHLSNLYDRSGQLDKAQALAEQALQVQTAQTGADSIMVADITEKLASIYRRLGKTDLATQFFNTAIQIKLSRNAVTTPYAPHPSWDNVTFRFLQGAPNCLRKFSQGNEMEITTANGVTIGVSVASQQKGALAKNTQVNIRLRNESGSNVQFLSQPPALIVLGDKIYFSQPIDSSQLAQKVEKKGESKAKWIRFMGANATQSMTSTMIGNGGFWGYPPVYSYGGAMPFVSRSGNMTTMITQVPDYAAQARALQKAADVTERSRETAEAIRASTLGATTVAPGQTLEGSLFFDTTEFRKGIVQLPIGNSVFEFEFPPR